MTACPSLRSAACVTAALALANVICFVAQAAQPCEANDLGCSIFNGQRAVPAQLRDDDHPLPGSITRCVNCHSLTVSPDAFAPPLTPGNLFPAKIRRGGPASSYDQAAFCRTLRVGIDPAEVTLRKAMPHYQISDEECASLWRFLTKPLRRTPLSEASRHVQ